MAKPRKLTPAQEMHFEYQRMRNFVDKNREVFEKVIELEARGFNVEAYFQDVIADKVKPKRCYWQTDQAKESGA